MISAIPPIAAPTVPGIGQLAVAGPGVDAAGAAGSVGSALAGTQAAAGTGTDFAAQLGQGLQNLQATQDKADGLAVQAATGSLTDVHDYLVASTQASLATQLTMAVRNKAVEAFSEIMRMQG